VSTTAGLAAAGLDDPLAVGAGLEGLFAAGGPAEAPDSVGAWGGAGFDACVGSTILGRAVSAGLDAECVEW
jgi:hypothetical protein